MRRLAIAAVVILLPAPAAAQTVCGALDRIAAAARERAPFASVRAALANGEAVVPGFEARDCDVRLGAVSCRVTDFVAGNFDRWPEPLSCAGLIAVPSFPGRHNPNPQHVYRFGALRIEYGVDCYGCAGGARSYFIASVDGRHPD
jgi:hypothetical protein